jgi:hypothetical protein
MHVSFFSFYLIPTFLIFFFRCVHDLGSPLIQKIADRINLIPAEQETL